MPCFFSVIICTYNRVALLPRAVESLRSQTYRNFDVVILDDGSTDHTRQFAEQLIQMDRRFRYRYQKNGGLSAARNAGIAASTGSYITFLDSDDEYAPDHLANRAAYLANHPTADMLYGGMKVVGGPATVPDCNDPFHMIPLTDCFAAGTFVVRRSVMALLEGFRTPDYGNDYEFAQRALELFEVHKVDYPTYIYHRETPDSMCNTMENCCNRSI